MSNQASAYDQTKSILLSDNNSGITNILEALLDTHGLGTVLQELVELCDAKAEHIRHEWQDIALAKQWERHAGKILIAANAVKS